MFKPLKETSIFSTLWSWASNSKLVRIKEEEIAQWEENWAQNSVNSSNINFRWHSRPGNGSRISEEGSQAIKVKIKIAFKNCTYLFQICIQPTRYAGDLKSDHCC